MFRRLTAIVCLAFTVSASLHGADAPLFPQPQKEHAWLQQFVGEWELESEAAAGPGQPAMKCQGTEAVRSIGGFWIVSDLHSQVHETSISAVLTLGYDPESKQYVGTWIDSTNSYLWKYQGSVDPTGKIITLEAEGPNPMLGGKVCKFRDVTEFKSADLRTMSSAVQMDSGEWVTFMTGTARRKPQPATKQ